MLDGQYGTEFLVHKRMPWTSSVSTNNLAIGFLNNLAINSFRNRRDFNFTFQTPLRKFSKETVA